MFYPQEYFSLADTRREIELLDRTLDFGDDEELSNVYAALDDGDRDLVHKVINELTGGADNFGYNLKVMLDNYRDCEDFTLRVNLMQLLKGYITIKNTIGMKHYLKC